MSSEPTFPPLVVTSDDGFAESARRWCAAVGREAETVADLGRVRRAWRSAPAIVVDARDLSELLAAEVPRRDQVVVVAPQPHEVWRPALRLGARDVVAHGDDEAVVEALLRALDGAGEACTVAIVGACGGVGASTLATATARSAVDRGLRAVLVDGDPTAGGLDLVAGAERVAGARWDDLDGAVGHVAVDELTTSLPVHRGVTLVSFGRDAGPIHGVAPVVSAAVRGFDLVVADVPRHLDDLGRELLTRALLIVLVVPRRLTGIVAARRLIERLDVQPGELVAITRACSGGPPSAVVARELGVPVLADVRHCRRLAVDVEQGLGPAKARPVLAASRRILDTVGLR